MRFNHGGTENTERKMVLLRALCVSVVILVSISSLISRWQPSAHSALHSPKGLEMPVQDRTRIRAPELTGDRGWLNTDKPLSLAGLRGKVVLLDFWTYGCINCMHIIPDLKKLEKKYANQLV